MSFARGVDGPGRPLIGVRGDVAASYSRGELVAVAALAWARRRRDIVGEWGSEWTIHHAEPSSSACFAS